MGVEGRGVSLRFSLSVCSLCFSYLLYQTFLHQLRDVRHRVHHINSGTMQMRRQHPEFERFGQETSEVVVAHRFEILPLEGP